ncbi:MAG: helix-turn-helix domain-containing protein [Halobacteriales archaeon]
MSNLLPSTSDSTSATDATPRIVGLDSEDADELLSALSSDTARKLLAALHDDPATPSKVADRIDTSLQNVQYHLEKLEAADAIKVVDTVYSEKGREMNVYAPTDQPLVVFAGDDEASSGLKTALSRLLGGLGVLAAGALVVQSMFGTLGLGGLFGGGGSPGGGDAAGTATEVGQAPASETLQVAEPGLSAVEATATAASNAPDASAGLGLPPGLFFFAGGALMLLLVFSLWYVRGFPGRRWA